MPRKPNSYDPTQLSDIPLTLHAPAFLDAWRDWCEDRRERRKPMTRRAATIALNKLATMSPCAACAAIRYSIERGYTGIFPDPTHKPATPAQGTGKPVAEAWKDMAKAALRADEDEGYLAHLGLSLDAIREAKSPFDFHIDIRNAIMRQAKATGVHLHI